MCEKCPPPSMTQPTDVAAIHLAQDLVARSQELLSPGMPSEEHARNILLVSHTYCRNALIAHMGGVETSELVRAVAHMAAIEIRSQAETLLKKAGLPPELTLGAMQGVTDQFTEHLARSLAYLARPIDDLLFTPPGPSKDAS